ncbi:MAG TPA: hypothetical protein VLV86_21530 [Vicinamibacterales bacterium]|nr:hypothetical protein [Vicinamibacterales bacterium]
MRRGALSEKKSRRRSDIAAALEAQGLPAALALRMAFQFVSKFADDELGDHAVWRAAGQILRQEVARLQHHLGLAERQIVCVLPKLSARQVEDFLDELRAADRRIARTIFDAAIEAAHPVSTGRRYLAEYRDVEEQLQALDPSVARTLANACFTATAPRRKAMEHFKRFATLLKQFDDNVDFARLLAKAAFRSADPVKTAESIVSGYHAVIDGLTKSGVDPHIARTLASSSRFRNLFRKTPGRDESRRVG